MSTFTTSNKPIQAQKPGVSLTGLFDDYNHTNLKGLLGARVSNHVDQVKNGSRMQFANGTLYSGPNGFASVHGAIEARYNQLGGPDSWLGLPKRDEEQMSEDGRSSVFDNGAIYWWPDVGAVDLGHVIVHFTGLICFGETNFDGFSPHDEPYVSIGVVTPAGGSTANSQIYDGVDGGESRPDLIEVYRGNPLGMTLNVMLAEHNSGHPDELRKLVNQGVQTAMDKLVPALANALKPVPTVGPALAVAASAILPMLIPTIEDFINDVIGTDDEVLGAPVLHLTAKQMVVLAARTKNSIEKDIGFKFETPLISKRGASYKVYFGIVPTLSGE